MAIVILEDGGAVLAAEIQGNWDACRTVINAQTTSTIRRKVFNHYHLPTHIAPTLAGAYKGYDHVNVGPLTIVAATYPFSSFTDPDIRTNWNELCKLDGGGGAGYQILVPSKVLIWASVDVKNFVNTGTDYKACFAVTASINGVLEARIDTADDGFLLADSKAYGNATLLHHEYEWQHLSFWTLLEHTGGTYNLSALRLRASAEGSNYVIQNATLGFVALYRTNA